MEIMNMPKFDYMIDPDGGAAIGSPSSVELAQQKLGDVIGYATESAYIVEPLGVEPLGSLENDVDCLSDKDVYEALDELGVNIDGSYQEIKTIIDFSIRDDVSTEEIVGFFETLEEEVKKRGGTLYRILPDHQENEDKERGF